MRRIVTGDETWIHHYDPETKQQSMQWKHASSPDCGPPSQRSAIANSNPNLNPNPNPNPNPNAMAALCDGGPLLWRTFAMAGRPRSPSPRKFKVQASAGKIMCTVFWDSEGILLIDYMPHKVLSTVTQAQTGRWFTDVVVAFGHVARLRFR